MGKPGMARELIAVFLASTLLIASSLTYAGCAHGDRAKADAHFDLGVEHGKSGRYDEAEKELIESQADSEETKPSVVGPMQEE